MHQISGSCTQTTRDLAALNYPGASGDMEIRIPASVTIPTPGGTTTSDYYTVELRDKSLWYRGIPQNSVLLHLHGLDVRSYWVDKFGGGFVGHQGAFYLGDEFVDSGNNVTVAVNRSSSPPNTVPSYMGVIVARSVSKSGSTITGVWGKIVVIKTVAGYDSNPGHPGTGTVVPTFCG